MKTKVILLITILLVTSYVSCQAYKLKIDTLTIINAGDYSDQIIISIVNTDKEPIWIWLNNIEDNQDDSSAIKEHLMKRKKDFSLFDIATDPNMEGELWIKPLTHDLFYNLFVKILKPGDSFTIVFFKNTEKATLQLKKNLKIYSHKQILEICKGIETNWGLERISYPYSAIIIPIKKE